MKDLQSNFFGRDTNDFGYSLPAAPGTSDGLSPATETPLGGMWPMTQPISTTRRNSTSSVSSISSARNRMNLNPLTSMANMIPETTTATLSAAISSISTMEEKFRGRAYSDGASSLSVEFNSQIQQQPIGSSRYKTELCRPFKENGKCKYGDKCQFAHGRQELRHLIRHPKYKTELCRTFHTSGFCPYGPRCHFIHNQDDVNRSNFCLQTPPGRGDRSQGPGTTSVITQGSPMPVPTPHISERNHYHRRPAQLNLSRQLSTGSIYGNAPYQQRSFVSGSPPYYHQDMTCSSLMSPTSPSSGSAGTMFQYPTNPAVALANMMSAQPQFDDTFDMLLSQGQSQFESTVNDDSAFDGPMTPPDSDRESMTGSPPEKQRLPIFRCLSQS